MSKKRYVIMAVDGGFYYFGEYLDDMVEQGYHKLTNAAMFGGFEGGKGLPGVHRGADGATVTLDRYAPDTILVMPESAVLTVMENCVDLYNFKGTTLR